MATTSTLPMAALTFLRDALAAVDGVQTCRIGLEANMTPDDYPIVRIVPSNLRRATAVALSQLVREIDCLVYFGVPVQEFEDGAKESGLENLYAEIFALEAALIAALPTTGAYQARYVETITDEDRIASYKLMAMRITLSGTVASWASP